MAAMTTSAKRMPAIFFGHGNPMYAIEPNRYSDAWRRLGESLPRPAAVLAVSAHWYTRGTAVTALAQPRTLHDFGGFPRALFDVQYPAPGSPALARRVQQLLAPPRDEGVLIAGSGNIVHNLRRLDWSGGGSAFDWAQRFSEHVRDRLLAGDHAALIDYLSFGDDAHESAPTPEHYLPLLYVIAQQQAGEAVTFPVEGIDMGAIDMRTVALI